MRIQDIQKLARKNRITCQGKTKTDLIREIQRREGNFECFGTARGNCDQLACIFRTLCLSSSCNPISSPPQPPGGPSWDKIQGPGFYSTGYLSNRMLS